MLKIFEAYRKQQAIRSYLRRLRPRLVKRYGQRDHYTSKQVRSTLYAGGLSVAYDCYAYAIYCSPEEFGRYHEAIGEDCNYSEMRAEVARLYDDSGSGDADNIDFSDSAFAEADGGGGGADSGGGGAGGGDSGGGD